MPDHPRFPNLFRPFNLKGVEIKNRIAISAHFAGWWVGQRGLPTDAFAAYIEERAKGGVGLFVIGATSPMPGSGWMENTSDAIVPRYRLLAESGRRHGMKVFAQLCHPGFRPLPGVPVVMPHPSINRQGDSRRRHIPDQNEVRQLVEAFGRAAGRAAEGGVDGLELHSHESFLHAQFLNPLWNTRTDEYGGSLSNRMRFLVETLRAMRAAIGPSKPLGVRLKLDDMAQRGMTADEYIDVIHRLEVAGLVDYVILTGGDGRFHHGPMPRPEGEWLEMVRRVRMETRLALLHAGRIATPEMAERALKEGIVDLVCMTKAHICDPHHARKAFENRLEDIRFCTRCLQACHGTMQAMTCVYNPVTSREAEWGTLRPAPRKKRVVVVGGGPAGMEAALTLAERGHRVTVLERSGRVGGQTWTGASSPLRANWRRIPEFYARQAKKGLFEVKLRKEATAQSVLALRPHAVILATGSKPKAFEIGGRTALTVFEVVEGLADGSTGALVYDLEGSSRCLVAADYLASKGVPVTLITKLSVLCETVEGMMLEEMMVRLREKGVVFSVGEELIGYEGDRAHLRNQAGRERLLPGIDALVATVGMVSENSLETELRGRVAELHVIGDAKEPRNMVSATYEGGKAGREV